MEKLMQNICDELDKIAEKGFNQGNLDTAYKLVDMYKDLKEAESMEGGYSGDWGGEYSERHRGSRGRYSREGGTSYDGGSSYARRGENYARSRYSRDGYSRNEGYSRDGGYAEDRYGRYMDSKASYRSTKSPECKQRLMSTLEEYMDDFSQQMEEMLRDSDCAEERTTIKRYLEKIKNLT